MNKDNLKGRYLVRWMIRGDLPEVIDIENKSFDFPWNEDDLLNVLNKEIARGVVVENPKNWEEILGFMIYNLHKNRLYILNLGVHPEYRRKGIGTAMVDVVKRKLLFQRRTRILLEVGERNLEAQLFFKSQGFRATSVLRNFYDDTNEDGYLMEYNYKDEISKYLAS